MANLDEIGDLLEVIAMHYPAFSRQIMDIKGGLRKDVCEEWGRIIGFLDYSELLDRLDVYMDGPTGRRPPMAVDFKRSTRRTSEYFHVEAGAHKWYLKFMPSDKDHKHGRLYDEEDREYVHSAAYEDGYHYNRAGQICTLDGIPMFQGRKEETHEVQETKEV